MRSSSSHAPWKTRAKSRNSSRRRSWTAPAATELGTIPIPAHVLVRTVLDQATGAYTAELSWQIRAGIELFPGVQFPRGSDECAAHLLRAREMDFMKGFPERAAEHWE